MSSQDPATDLVNFQVQSKSFSYIPLHFTKHMKYFVALFLLVALAANSIAQPSANRYYELRIYDCHPGKLATLLERFQNHTLKLFEKHGMENVGYWVPINNEKELLY